MKRHEFFFEKLPHDFVYSIQTTETPDKQDRLSDMPDDLDKYVSRIESMTVAHVEACLGFGERSDAEYHVASIYTELGYDPNTLGLKIAISIIMGARK